MSIATGPDLSGWRTFQARYIGRCGRCDQKIQPGQWVGYEDEELVHVDCPDESGPIGEVCPACWCIHRGECA